ncbi:hypothetical protein IMSAGC013_02779 [Lachnospiraceae bacterium]|nr:hypothetical protein IMSAGC013_02779 [Lachnospiraceae bacterium]
MIQIRNIELNDRVVITSDCNNKGYTGVVIGTYYAGYSRHCKYVMIHLDKGIKQGYNQRSVRKIENKGECENMTGFNRVAIVNLLEDYSKKDYAFALYDTEFRVLSVGDLVVVNARGKDNRVLGTVKEVMTIDEYGKGVNAQVVAVVNMDAYNARIEEENKAKEVAKKKVAIKKELEEEINKRKTVEFYEEMANKYSDNPRLAELVAELKGLGA